MSEIKITVAANFMDPLTFMFEGTTAGELREYLARIGVSTSGKSLREGNLRVEFISDDTLLPRVKSDGTPLAELFIMISEPNNKIKSGNGETPDGIAIIFHSRSEQSTPSTNQAPSTNQEIAPINGISASIKQRIEDQCDAITDSIDELLEIVDGIPTLSEAATRIRQVQSSFSAEEMDRMLENYCD